MFLSGTRSSFVNHFSIVLASSSIELTSSDAFYASKVAGNSPTKVWREVN